jgi:hypothetical protein
MTVLLLDNSLKVKIFFELLDCEYGDNICVNIVEKCIDDEKVFRGDETNLYLTPRQARKLAAELVHAAEHSEKYCASKESDVSPGI